MKSSLLCSRPNLSCVLITAATVMGSGMLSAATEVMVSTLSLLCVKRTIAVLPSTLMGTVLVSAP